MLGGHAQDRQHRRLTMRGEPAAPERASDLSGGRGAAWVVDALVVVGLAPSLAAALGITPAQSLGKGIVGLPVTRVDGRPPVARILARDVQAARRPASLPRLASATSAERPRSASTKPTLGGRDTRRMNARRRAVRPSHIVPKRSNV
jgi:hypothetical protein